MPNVFWQDWKTGKKSQKSRKMDSKACFNPPAVNDGFILLDKPIGITSRQAGWRAAKIFGQRVFGHIGTLDPMASGLLIVALGQATKMIPFFPDAPKEYLFSVKWGVKTDTGDITGSVAEQGGRIPTMDEIRAVLPSLVGEYDQTPPAFSAKKIGGVPSYKLARQGRAVMPAPKKINVYELEIIESAGHEPADADGNPSQVFRVKCGAGTYVRALAGDIAEKLGTVAACSMIRRVKTNGLDIKDAAALDFLENLYNNGGAALDNLKPLDFGLDDIPVAKLETIDSILFSNGGFVPAQGAGIRRVYSEHGFVGIGTIERGLIKPKRLIRRPGK
jgi:tRNA pseudouridine55 synthase